VLTTENGSRITNTVVLDPEVLLNFELWLKQLREEPQPNFHLPSRSGHARTRKADMNGVC
jgi:hypothetical protein